MSCESALLVGHQPHLGRLFGRLASGEGPVEVAMKKASLAAFETAGEPGSEPAELRYYLTPRLLERLG
jgi:phosphohistidine phosphatase SixA